MVSNTYIILQARMNSTRLPGKVMQTIGGTPLIGILLKRLKDARLPIILATSINKENDTLEKYATRLGIYVFRGNENNVLERFYFAAKEVNAKTIIRITGDNPLLDGYFLKEQVEDFFSYKNERKYLSTSLSQTYPLGMSVEIFNFNLLEEAYKHARLPGEFEHVTPYMHQNKPGNIEIITPKREKSRYHYRLTVDTEDDFFFNKKLIEEYGCDNLKMNEIIATIDKHPELTQINKTSVQKTWNE
ncbi:glycosyltransferase family protein [Marinilabilia sp.]|uniref:glycosyltransferase family protein n=1 Tax=Marinilabilia sp. TaxID=2021252 RepID=UPI0025BBA451|nr:glycosyltransferase family protein [Marinilabilia sp.]